LNDNFGRICIKSIRHTDLRRFAISWWRLYLFIFFMYLFITKIWGYPDACGAIFNRLLISIYMWIQTGCTRCSAPFRNLKPIFSIYGTISGLMKMNGSLFTPDRSTSVDKATGLRVEESAAGCQDSEAVNHAARKQTLNCYVSAITLGR